MYSLHLIDIILRTEIRIFLNAFRLLLQLLYSYVLQSIIVIFIWA